MGPHRSLCGILEGDGREEGDSRSICSRNWIFSFFLPARASSISLIASRRFSIRSSRMLEIDPLSKELGVCDASTTTLHRDKDCEKFTE